MRRRHPRSTLFPYTTLFRSKDKKKGKKQSFAVDRVLPHQQLLKMGHQRSRKPPTELSQKRSKMTLSLWLSSRSEEHTSELQSRRELVCRLLLEKKKKKKKQK